MQSGDTIAAVSTPPGEGAVALIRISGPDSLRLLPGQRPGIPVGEGGLLVNVSFDPDVRAGVRLDGLGDGFEL